MLDKNGIDINHAIISLANKCNLDCIHCISKYDEFENEKYLQYNEYKFIIECLSEMGIKSIDFIGKEVLLYDNILDLISFAKKCNIEDISISTNGSILNDKVYDLKYSGVTNVIINIPSLKQYRYKSITKSDKLNEVLKSINECLKLGINVQLDIVIISDLNNDEIYDFLAIAKQYPIDVNFIEFTQGNTLYRSGYINVENILENISQLQYLDDEKYYKLENSSSKIKITKSKPSDRCDECNKLAITANGYIKYCVDSSTGFKIDEYINRPMLFKEFLKEIILSR